MTQECQITQFLNISESKLSSPTQLTMTTPTLRIFRARCRHQVVAKWCQGACWSKIMFPEIASYSPTMREKILIVPSSTICEKVAELLHFNEDLLALEELQLPGRQGLEDDEVELLEGRYLLAVKNWTYYGTCVIYKRSFEIFSVLSDVWDFLWHSTCHLAYGREIVFAWNIWYMKWAFQLLLDSQTLSQLKKVVLLILLQPFNSSLQLAETVCE